jgi:hypothetical protein
MRCIERRKDWMKKRRLKLKAAGKCVDCASPNRPIAEGSSLCATCKAARLRRNFEITLRLSREDFARWQAARKRAA